MSFTGLLQNIMDLPMKNKIAFLVSVLSILSVSAEPITLESLRKNIAERDHIHFRAKAKQAFYSRYDVHNDVLQPDADLEFEVFGVDFMMKGYTQDRAHSDYYEDHLHLHH